MQSAQPSLSGNADQQQAQNNLTPEENATLLEVQREMYQSQNNPMHGLFRPRDLRRLTPRVPRETLW